jgi:hypothetical protein
MKTYRAGWIIITIIIFHLGCYHEYPKTQYRPLNMSSISLGMTEEEVRKVLGSPADVIGSRYYKGDHVIKVLQYIEAKFTLDTHDVLMKNFYLYFLDGKLVQWGRPGDWEKEADKIYEIRIR